MNDIASPAAPTLEDVMARLAWLEQLILQDRLEKLEGAEGAEGTDAPAARVQTAALLTTATSPALAFEQFIDGLNLKHFHGAEFTPYWVRERNGVRNSVPPKSLWGRIVPTLAVLERFRGEFGAPVQLISTYRSSKYNQAVSGALQSQHVEFRAVDFTCGSGTPAKWAALLRSFRGQSFQNPATGQSFVFRGGIGVYPKNNFVHVDTRGNDADW